MTSHSGDAGNPMGATASAEKPANALPIPAASIAAAVNPLNLPSYEGPTGSIEGTILVRGPTSPDLPTLDFHACPAAIDTYGKLFREGPPSADGLRPLADALVMAIGENKYFVPERNKAKAVTISANCAYPTRTIALTFGQRLEVTNESTLSFAPRLDGAYLPAVMIAPPVSHGEPVKLYPPRPGHYVLSDTMQPFVKEDVFVLRYPMHAVSDAAGHYRIDGLPVGHFTVAALLGAIDSQTEKEVNVRPNVVEKLDLVLVYDPDASANRKDAGAQHWIP